MRRAEETQRNQVLREVVGDHAAPVLRLERRRAVGQVDVDDHHAKVGHHEKGRTTLVEEGEGQQGEELRRRRDGVLPSAGS